MKKAKVITALEDVRINWAYLAEPFTDKEGKESYKVQVLIPKSDKAKLKQLKAVQMEAIEKAWGEEPKRWHNTIHDGDGEKENGEEFSPECKGHYIFTTSSKTQPRLLDRALKPADPKVFYDGCVCSLELSCSTYDGSKKGVTFYLNAVQFIEDGEEIVHGGGGGSLLKARDPLPLSSKAVATTADDDDEDIF